VALRKIVRDTDPEIPLNDIRSMDTRVDESLITRRSPALLTGIFAAVALVLAAVGIYGVLSYAVSQRHREIGVRMALGALPKQVLAQFLSLGVKLLLLGTALGLIGAWAAGRAMHTILFGIGAVQPWLQRP
jgi:ABC-type antimicrobial peptide transport system permease subunit